MEIEIEKVSSGYIIKTVDGKFVVGINEDIEEIKGEQLAFRELCYILRNIFDINNDKHKNQYLDIIVSGEDE